jgi:hypothetical protein
VLRACRSDGRQHLRDCPVECRAGAEDLGLPRLDDTDVSSTVNAYVDDNSRQ